MRLAARSVPRFDRPVTLPPGRASETTRPLPIGSPAVERRSGMLDVACFAAIAAFGSRSDNDISLAPDKLGRELGIALCASLAPTVLDCDGAALDPAEFAQPPNKCIDPRALACSRPTAEPADRRHRLLCARRERPSRRGRRAE